MSNIDKRALREAAEKATPGPWGIARNGKTITSNQSHPVAVITEDFHRLLANGKTGGDAEFIAAANPATVLALLDELEAKDKQIAEQRETLFAARSHVMQCARLGDAHANGVLQAIDRAAAGKGE